jgi:hypothetical protein
LNPTTVIWSKPLAPQGGLGMKLAPFGLTQAKGHVKRCVKLILKHHANLVTFNGLFAKSIGHKSIPFNNIIHYK